METSHGFARRNSGQLVTPSCHSAFFRLPWLLRKYSPAAERSLDQKEPVTRTLFTPYGQSGSATLYACFAEPEWLLSWSPKPSFSRRTTWCKFSLPSKKFAFWGDRNRPSNNAIVISRSSTQACTSSAFHPSPREEYPHSYNRSHVMGSW
jgi:hypothetical protein